MIAAIGFLAASLIALLIIPAVNARAERLARRRVEAQFPLSISELTAEKDHLRAEFAVTQRRIERKAEEALASKRQDMEELGRRALRVEALTNELSGRDGRIAALEGELAEAKGRLAKTEEELRGAAADLSSIRDTLSALEGAHRATLDELGAARGELEGKEATLAEARKEIAAARDALAAREASVRDLEAQKAQALAEIDAKRIRISDLETRLATQTVRGDEFERVASEQRTEISMTRQRLADLSKARAVEEEEARALRERASQMGAGAAPPDASAAKALADLRATRDMLLATLDNRVDELRAARRRLAELEGGAQGGGDARTSAPPDQRPEAATADARALEAALAAARADRDRLESELASLRERSASDGEAIRAENAELRRRIDEVADQILRATAEAAPVETREWSARRQATGDRVAAVRLQPQHHDLAGGREHARQRGDVDLMGHEHARRVAGQRTEQVSQRRGAAGLLARALEEGVEGVGRRLDRPERQEPGRVEAPAPLAGEHARNPHVPATELGAERRRELSAGPLRLRCVSHSPSRKPGGSPVPGASA